MTETKETTSRQSEGLSLSATQLAGSVLAAVSASVAASVFGVAGTVIGAALGSIISVVGSAVYSYSLRRTQARVRSTLDLAVAKRFDVRGAASSNPPSDALPAESTTPDPSVAAERDFTTAAADLPGVRSWRRMLTLKPKQLGIAAAALFVLTLVLITGFEVVSGRPVSATVTDKQGSGVSLVGGHTSKPPRSSAPASPTSSPTDTVTSDGPSDTPSATPSESLPDPQSSSTPTSDAPTDTPSVAETPSSSPSVPTESAPASSSPAQLETPTPTAGAVGG